MQLIRTNVYLIGRVVLDIENISMDVIECSQVVVELVVCMKSGVCVEKLTICEGVVLMWKVTTYTVPVINSIIIR